MTFAIVEDGGRQYKVCVGDQLAIDLRSDVLNGGTINFDRVLLTSVDGVRRLGLPLLDGASVVAEVVEAEVKAPKLEIQKFRRRKNYRRHTGHRQRHTIVKINSIVVP